MTRRIIVSLALLNEQESVRRVRISFLFRRGVSCCTVEEGEMADFHAAESPQKEFCTELAMRRIRSKMRSKLLTEARSYLNSLSFM